MATINASDNSDQSVGVVKWLAITENDTGSAVSVSGRAFAIQADGDFTTSGAVTLEGSNNGSDWVTIKDSGGTDVVMVAANKIWYVTSYPRLLRPRATAGSAVSMNITLYMQK